MARELLAVAAEHHDAAFRVAVALRGLSLRPCLYYEEKMHDPAPHNALLQAVDSAITNTIATIRKNGGTTSRWALLIFDPKEVQAESAWPETLKCNGKIVLHMPSHELADNLIRHWNIEVSAEARSELEAPTEEGVLRCVTVVDRVARPIEMTVPTLTPGGVA